MKSRLFYHLPLSCIPKAMYTHQNTDLLTVILLKKKEKKTINEKMYWNEKNEKNESGNQPYI